VALLFALLLPAQAHTCLAVNGIIWRAFSLSWDNPATQLLEEMALEGVPHTGTFCEADARTLAAKRGASPLLLAVPPDAPGWLLAFARGTGAPPSA
jgi:hypothetical protein